VVVVAAGGFGVVLVDLVLIESVLAEGAGGAAQDGKGVTVLTGQLDADVGVAGLGGLLGALFASGESAACRPGDSSLASDHQRGLVERDRHAPSHRLLDRELVVASSQILHEAMSGDHDPGAAVLLEPAHRPQPRCEATVVSLDAAIGVLLGAMPGHRQRSSSTAG